MSSPILYVPGDSELDKLEIDGFVKSTPTFELTSAALLCALSNN